MSESMPAALGRQHSVARELHTYIHTFTDIYVGAFQATFVQH